MDAPESLINEAVFRVEQPPPEERACHIRHDAREEDNGAVEGHPLDFLVEEECESEPQDECYGQLEKQK